ncbi:hypothetical protein TVAG_410690 [Trichomonas vaginalis G3]|uniref:HEAT repeat family protein n=1 Tax=Trichomonas vaginalis (strain ATCC PRA-98 / G3) TaxID=412133 RepID=A2FU58_TRIV3|nr:meiotic spindle elongation [Trichomonas vaginalis G3]EAX91556.1 hypothetical protein TVAG_410690 [Trichomonas vaginalis G3]KAI5523717.1 meiotic spindle elongation [Trichomonas vaginalis G3]|eukprot:XP_001304486.1 hypothetical protein [Trichomonas vaginalis G3]
MSVASAITLFEKAVTQDESSQYEFACNVEKILTSFPPKFIAEEFYPFMATWIPRNNARIVKTLAEKVDKMAAISEAIVSLAPVVESLLAAENVAIAKIILQKIRTVKLGGDVMGFFKRLASSPLDFVRAFVAKIIMLLKSNDDVKNLSAALICDPAFQVRFSMCSVIPKLQPDLAKDVASYACSDSNSRVKSFLPVICSKLPFFFNDIVTPLLLDHDWAVRASLARELANSTDDTKSLTYCIQLIKDSVWQVVLCALTSLTTILNRNKSASYDFLPQVLDVILNNITYPQTSLKNAAIDAFLSIYTRCTLDQKKVNAFVECVIIKQPPNTRLHFLEALATTKHESIFALISFQLFGVITNLMESDQWRVRLGVVQLLSALAAVSKNGNLSKQFSQLCIQCLDDEATPVRVAASEQLVQFFLAEKGSALLPESFAALKASNSFRKRQSALYILSNIGKTVKTPEQKNQILQELKAFEGDACENVVNLAREFIANL